MKTTAASLAAAPILARLKAKRKSAQKWLDNEVLNDCEPYVPYRTGALTQSGKAADGGGLIVYTAHYAKKQYYGSFSHAPGVHPKATRKWFETAKAVNQAKWIKGVKELGGK